MYFKKTIAISIAFIAIGLSLNAEASGPSLRIVNNTNNASTIKVKMIDGSNEVLVCSNQFGALPNDGVLPPHSYTDLTNVDISLACTLSNPNACPLDIYLTKDCTGPVIGKIILNVTTGIQQFSTTQEGMSSGYSINLVNPFYLEINSGS